MYSTCLFCHAKLGTNQAIEHFPIGRRLAFDGAKGRLWVVCGGCERWNLTPLEERWEAIEECERAFRDTKLRVSTDNVGLARLREGTTLVRIGEPQRPELAAWRYGDQFGRRRRRHIAMMTGASVVAAGAIIAGPVMGVLGGGAINLLNVGNFVHNARTLARVTVGDEQYGLNARAFAKVLVVADEADGFTLEIPYVSSARSKLNVLTMSVTAAFIPQQPTVTARGAEALRAARILLPRINQSGGNAASVRDAVDIIEATPDARDLFVQSTRPGQRAWWSKLRRRVPLNEGETLLLALPAAQRLALEMALHEEDERRALEGELSVLEARWKEAEEIAAISDDMFLPDGVMDRFRAFKLK